MLPLQKLQHVLDRHAAIEAELSSALPTAAMVRLSRERAGIEPVAGAILAYRGAQAELRELEGLRDDPASDGEMRAMAEEERAAVQERLAMLEQDLQLLLLPKDAADDNDVIVEVRAGTGGDEASLFAGDLFRMYTRYAELQGWTVEVLSTSEGAMGGFKEVVAAICGRGAFARMKFESGVHRVQRVPATETSGRIHTSAATVAVLPQAEEVDVTINEADLRIDVYRAQGAGGQHVNKTESAVRITHMPSGVVVAVQDERSQHRNKARAMDMLRAKLFDIERQSEENARSADRKAQVGTGDRSARIRTYNFPQGRITDHRIGLTLHKLEQVLEGSGLGELISALIADHQARMLAAENETA